MCLICDEVGCDMIFELCCLDFPSLLTHGNVWSKGAAKLDVVRRFGRTQL